MESLRRAVETSNPWRVTGKVEPWRLGTVPRPEAQVALRRLGRPGPALLVEGPRRVGKSTVLFQVLAGLLETVPRERILYLSLDDPLLDPEAALGDLEKFVEAEVLGRPLQHAARQDPVVLLLDEITLVQGWERWIKRWVDRRFPLRVLATSSALAFARGRSRESLPGRLDAIELWPFSFAESLRLREDDLARSLSPSLEGVARAWRAFLDKPDLDRLERALQEIHPALGTDTVEPLLDAYLREGGFPEYLTAAPEDREGYFWRTVVERVLYRDLPALVGEVDRRILARAMFHGANHTARLANFASLASDWGVSRATVGNYFRHLEVANLLRLLPRFARTAEARARGLLKVFAIDPGLALDLRREPRTAPLRDDTRGALLETAVHAQFLRLGASSLHHWRERDREVDLVLESGSAAIAIEVRAGADGGSLAGLEAFETRFRGTRSIVLYRGPLRRAGPRLLVPVRLFFG